MNQFYKRHSKGSSLVFVIIAIAFVGILGSILLNVTMINIETKGIDREVKKNFYKTETVMDKLNVSLENISEKAMKAAYVKLMGNYTKDIMDTTDQAAIQASFAEDYINNILVQIAPSVTLANAPGVGVDEDKKYDRTLTGNYDVDKIKNQVKTDFDEKTANFIETDPGKATLELAFTGKEVDKERYLLLKNMKVKYIENESTDKDSATSTWITTDIKFAVPILQFEGGGTYPNFTEYAIIGDEEVLAEGSKANIDGSLYAGYRGFNVNTTSTVNVKRKSANIITRGDVSVKQTSSLTLGEEENLVNVYAQNYKTEGVGSASTSKANLKIYANSYIMDDLSLDAPYSDVYFGGENAAYYGYSFNKDNTDDTRTVLNSQYSSAIVINGKHSSLEMDNKMSSVLLGGRAYISRTKQAEDAGLDRNDIMTGESLSVKSDQNFYLVSQEHMKEGYTNPMTWTKYDSIAGEVGKKEVLSNEITSRSSKIGKLLKSGKGQGVVPYVYDISSKSASAALVYFYYNFKSQDAANTYFKQYCDKTDVSKKIVSSEYLHFGENSISGMGVTISSNIALFASGNYMTYTSSGNKPGTYQSYDKTIGIGDDAKFKQQSIDYALTYKALQMELSTKNKSKYEPTFDGSNADKSNGYGMLGDDGKTLLEGNQIFDAIMTVNRSTKKHVFVEDASVSSSGFYDISGGARIKAVPVDVEGTTVWAVFVKKDNDSVSLNTVLNSIQYNNGTSNVTFDRINDVAIVVASCNIDADTNLRGLVISDEQVKLQNTVTITAEPSLLRSMFRKQRAMEGSKADAKDKFITYFEAFAGFTAGQDSNNAESSVDISRYITYSNWKKNNE